MWYKYGLASPKMCVSFQRRLDLRYRFWVCSCVNIRLTLSAAMRFFFSISFVRYACCVSGVEFGPPWNCSEPFHLQELPYFGVLKIFPSNSYKANHTTTPCLQSAFRVVVLRVIIHLLISKENSNSHQVSSLRRQTNQANHDWSVDFSRANLIRLQKSIPKDRRHALSRMPPHTLRKHQPPIIKIFYENPYFS